METRTLLGRIFRTCVGKVFVKGHTFYRESSGRTYRHTLYVASIENGDRLIDDEGWKWYLWKPKDVNLKAGDAISGILKVLWGNEDSVTADFCSGQINCKIDV